MMITARPIFWAGRSWLVKLISGVCVVGAVLIAGTVPASASRNHGNTWSANSQTGYCGDQTGGYDALAQTMLRDYGSYHDFIDDYWGTHSDSATRAYQTQNGLGVDGCLGPLTWTSLKNRTTYVSNQICSIGSTAVFHYGLTYTYNNTGAGYNAFEADYNDVKSPVAAYTPYWFDDPLVYAPC